MSEVTFLPMSDSDYDSFIEKSITSFAADSVRSGRLDADDSMDSVRNMVSKLLPDGMMTENHFFMNVCNGDSRVGSLWYGYRGNKVFIYDILINDEHRGHGFGTGAIELLEKVALKEGKTGLMLHVFGHNTGARRLYERLGFNVIGMEMEKQLGRPKTSTTC